MSNSARVESLVRTLIKWPKSAILMTTIIIKKSFICSEFVEEIRNDKTGIKGDKPADSADKIFLLLDVMRKSGDSQIVRVRPVQ